MSSEPEGDKHEAKNASEIIANLFQELQELYLFRNMFFENHSIEMASQKNDLVNKKKDILAEKFESIDVDTQIPFSDRAQFMYMKGRCYNINAMYDPRAAQYLSKAVKLNPQFVDAWNELGECYWKNMNVKEARASFEGALKRERNRISLRSLSIILRQESSDAKKSDAKAAILKSVELAKEAVSQDIKDGASWSVLGNAYLCQFFMVCQEPAILKSCMSAYKQAWQDPVSKAQPDLYYNMGIALKYEEQYEEALENFEHACRLDPPWDPPRQEVKQLTQYLVATNNLVHTKGKVKTKKLTQMIESLDTKMLGVYGPGIFHTFGARKNVTFERVRLDALKEGANEGKVILARVVGSIHSETAVPFTFAVVDESMECVCVTVYNWADGRGAIIGNSVCIPEPNLKLHKNVTSSAVYEFKSIRVKNPTLILLNSKRVGRNQYASTRVTSTYEIH